MFKTTDAGETWTPLSGGLPDGRLGRIGVATAGNGQKVFAIVAGGGGGGGGGGRGGAASGLYRSDDGGAHWSKSTGGPSHSGQTLFRAESLLDPNNSDVVCT